MGIARKLLTSMTDFERLISAARYSIAGLRAALRKEAAFRQEVILFVVMALFLSGNDGRPPARRPDRGGSKKKSPACAGLLRS